MQHLALKYSTVSELKRFLSCSQNAISEIVGSIFFDFFDIIKYAKTSDAFEKPRLVAFAYYDKKT